MARCRQCGASAEAGHRFCGERGCPLEGCPSCGEPVSAGKKFCHSCGFALNSTAPAPAVASRPGTGLPLSAQPAAAAAGAGPGPTCPPANWANVSPSGWCPGQATVPSRHQAIARPGQLGTPARTGNRSPLDKAPLDGAPADARWNACSPANAPDVRLRSLWDLAPIGLTGRPGAGGERRFSGHRVKRTTGMR
jgi:hypothetical protein